MLQRRGRGAIGLLALACWSAAGLPAAVAAEAAERPRRWHKLSHQNMTRRPTTGPAAATAAPELSSESGPPSTVPGGGGPQNAPPPPAPGTSASPDEAWQQTDPATAGPGGHGYRKHTHTSCGATIGGADDAYSTLAAAREACNQTAACHSVADSLCDGPPFTLCQTATASARGSCTWSRWPGASAGPGSTSATGAPAASGSAVPDAAQEEGSHGGEAAQEARAGLGGGGGGGQAVLEPAQARAGSAKKGLKRAKLTPGLGGGGGGGGHPHKRAKAAKKTQRHAKTQRGLSETPGAEGSAPSVSAFAAGATPAKKAAKAWAASLLSLGLAVVSVALVTRIARRPAPPGMDPDFACTEPPERTLVGTAVPEPKPRTGPAAATDEPAGRL